ncbi:P60-like protein [Whalleya microplaca]|nr:P60-like protein [Whalleya microplaca]
MPVIQPLKGSSDAPATYKQPSRKGKKAWRKNVDVTEIQEGLEELNEEIIKGGVVAERPSDELFTLDTSGDASIPKRFPKHTSKPLKADEIIAARSAVPAVSMRKRPGDKTTDGIVPAKRLRTQYVTQKELSRLRKVADGHHESTIEVTDATYDPWGEVAPLKSVVDKDKRDEKAKAPKSFSQKPLSLLASGKSVPAVPKPTGGYSYNPDFTDYEARYTEEGKKAVEAERKRLEAEEAERIKMEAAARSAAEAEAAEARAELSEWEEDSEWEGFQSGGEELKPTAKRPERKTKVQRNRIARRKEEERRLKHEAKTKVRKAQAEQIKQIIRETAEREKAVAALAQAQDSDSSSSGDDGEVLRRRQLGKLKLPEKDLELVLPDELQDSLRLLKPEGNLLKDRYRSLLIRGRMESRRRIPFRKKPKTKITEKWAYKDFSI